jgi:hypothetical protein
VNNSAAITEFVSKNSQLLHEKRRILKVARFPSTWRHFRVWKLPQSCLNWADLAQFWGEADTFALTLAFSFRAKSGHILAILFRFAAAKATRYKYCFQNIAK